ncbi:MAG: efflux RND transporter periplasmic adaptor subunit [Acidobacteria bacterium]|nr:efflux RND transporter periplasmic adaptor subunit [Acidobacteriota bacterium]
MTSTEQAEPQAPDSPPIAAPSAAASQPPAGLTRGIWIGLCVVAVVLAVVIVAGIASRSAADRALVRENQTAAILDVQIVHPAGTSTSDEVALPGDTQAFVDTPIYARTSGYLKSWYFDIGAHVRKGQLLATIETPELDQQLLVARSDLKTAEANLNLAKTTAARYTNLLKSNSVSKQETDVVVSDAAAKQSVVDAALSNVRRLEQLQGFENIYAPFDGVITARNTDIGALIDAGSSTTPKELFHMGAIGELRVFVAVPEAYSTAIKTGEKVGLTLDEYPGQTFIGTIARNSNAIDPTSRTLNVEVDIANPKGLLLPGAYVFVHFKVPDHATTLTLPANSLLFRAQGLQVATVRDGKVHLVPIAISRDQGATLQIATGLAPTDSVILDPSDSIAEGQQVRIVANSNHDDAGESH